MCISPNFVWVQRGPKWEQQPVACRQCWRCRQNRVNDYVARCLAEGAVSQHVATVTLTYAPRDDLADKVLHPRHFQLFMKLLRRAGHKVRYLVAGEYGDLKGRAHFHAILFFQDMAPLGDRPTPGYNDAHLADPSTSAPFCREIPQKRICHIREWPHGHIKVDWSADERAARYVCKYLLAENKNNAWFSLSKKPPLGAAWFAQRAARAVDLDVLPSTFEYLPPGGDSRRPYLMTGATRRDYLNAITQDTDDRCRMSEWVCKTFDKHALARAKDAFWKLPSAEQVEIISASLKVREMPLDKVLLSLRRSDLWSDYLSDEWVFQLAKQWRFDDVETFKEWVERGFLDLTVRLHDDARLRAEARCPAGSSAGAGSAPAS